MSAYVVFTAKLANQHFCLSHIFQQEKDALMYLEAEKLKAIKAGFDVDDANPSALTIFGQQTLWIEEHPIVSGTEEL